MALIYLAWNINTQYRMGTNPHRMRAISAIMASLTKMMFHEPVHHNTVFLFEKFHMMYEVTLHHILTHKFYSAPEINIISISSTFKSEDHKTKSKGTYKHGSKAKLHWNGNVIIFKKILSLTAVEVVNDDNFYCSQRQKFNLYDISVSVCGPITGHYTFQHITTLRNKQMLYKVWKFHMFNMRCIR